MGDGRSGNWVIWTRPQRAVVAGVLVILLAGWGYRAWRDRLIIPVEPTGAGARAGELDDRLDPNLATVAELATLAGIGERSARDIIAYREQFRADGRGEVAFERPTDLLKVKGVGTSVLEDVRPHLKYPTAAGSSDPVP